MKVEKIGFGEIDTFSPIFLDYLSGKDALKPFYNYLANLESFKKAIEERSNFSSGFRATLAEVLIDQYSTTNLQEPVKNNIELLKRDNTFTIVTGHQLNIFTGPLYFIYKIVTVINLAKKLKEAYPEYNFIPVYWMASEDHDFKEINHFNLFGNKISWESGQTGPVGRFSTENMIEELNLNGVGKEIDSFLDFYKNQNSLADAHLALVDSLFGKDGVVVVDADDSRLKAEFAPVIKNDIVNCKSNELTENQTNKLTDAGYKSQVFSREINFFYLEDTLRERIVKNENGSYEVLNTNISWSEKELMDEIDSRPEKFSPNVIMRPVYQETILPNLAYIGGPAEVAYWLQLKQVFDHYNTFFPILLPRNFALCLSKSNVKKFNKLNIDTKNLFIPFEQQKKDFIEQLSDNEITLGDEKKDIAKVFESIKNKAAEIDNTLQGFVGSEMAKTMKSIDNIEKRLQKAEEKRHEITLNQLESLLDKLFPNGSLQERHDNFLNFYLNHPNFIEHLKAAFDPLDFSFNILFEDE
ncbi:bacillithiol biosynthesis cysteine-adding enzyme BshC [Marinigracilibium pacificum]|uniref:Putative cysteine ligase BshC n=1 Tax=Marinigracilibium pacificum TaxID=2729599 RepID=A0A848IUN8_9BACT|nr:bacillithiol biosynthesis cysteine-adding enzyme BshC [Marinigracilibium pacificum]NMM46908.1 bacillithiol biosynthesis cysteine-adding enzyme BshC [Marinigracilibium pacificum]